MVKFQYTQRVGQTCSAVSIKSSEVTAWPIPTAKPGFTGCLLRCPVDGA